MAQPALVQTRILAPNFKRLEQITSIRVLERAAYHHHKAWTVSETSSDGHVTHWRGGRDEGALRGADVHYSGRLELRLDVRRPADVEAAASMPARRRINNNPGRRECKAPPGTLVGMTRLAKPEFLIEIDLIAVTT